MKQLTRFILATVMAMTPAVATATDVDGPGDCTHAFRDFGDAPEGFDAYSTPGVVGHFPTCMAPTAPGTRTALCPPISTVPGPTGYVAHDNADISYWLGCGTAGFDDGVDNDIDGKTSPGGGASLCSGLPVDCLEAAFGLVFGQDECYGSTDAGISAPPVFTTCSSSSIRFDTYNCSPVARDAYLNILVDWNHDGDWNDNGTCPGGVCWYEWAVKNVAIVIPSGCTNMTSPLFTTGNTGGEAWLRITISDAPVPDDFPWNGSAGLPLGSLKGGETEDYPVKIDMTTPDPCDDAYLDFGDAPEDISAYSAATIGHFPTCSAAGAPGTQNIVCAPRSTPPGPTGAVIHEGLAGDAIRYWLGCTAAGPVAGIDSELDGKINLSPLAGDPSACDPAVVTDCVETVFGGATFGQDECYGDADAGITTPLVFQTCSVATVPFTAYNCGPPLDVFLNILVDMNEDGDWNDNSLCALACAHEWAVKNVPIVLPAGCSGHVSPGFLVGPQAGNGWLRISLTFDPVPDDYPWNGSLGTPSGRFRSGETEDYPVTIEKPCARAYQDFGDAPEDLVAYPSGLIGHFPTCFVPTAPGNLNALCGVPLGTPPGPTGVVWHKGSAGDAVQTWLGCGLGPALGGLDDEFEGKVDLSPVVGPSHCDLSLNTDCVETLIGPLQYGQDECYGDGVDAGIGARLEFKACSLAVVPLRMALCSAADADVYLNILVDWNKDGDWNDNGTCLPTGTCVNEWSVKNVKVPLVPGCNSVNSPAFPVGLRLGPSWMRVTVTLDPVPDDFPWNGSAGTLLGYFPSGETEDYPVDVVTSTIVAVDEPGVPGQLDLAIQPNPSWDGATVRFALPRESEVRLGVYDITGRRISTLAGGTMPAGTHAVEWNYRTDAGGTAPVGLYMIRLEALGQVVTRTAIRIR